MSKSELFRIAIQKGNRPPDAKQRALDLYKPPFRYFADTWTVESEDGSGATVCKVDDHADGDLIAEALNEYYANHKDKNENN